MELSSIYRTSFLLRLDERVVNELLFNYGQARHQGDRQDRAFHDNPDKKAAMRKMRQGERGENGTT